MLAVQAGRVQRVAVIDGYGLTVLIDHGGDWSSFYAHLQQASVEPAERVGAGQPLELRQRHPQDLVAVDPTPLLPASPAGGAIAGDLLP